MQRGNGIGATAFRTGSELFHLDRLCEVARLVDVAALLQRHAPEPALLDKIAQLNQLEIRKTAGDSAGLVFVCSCGVAKLGNLGDNASRINDGSEDLWEYRAQARRRHRILSKPPYVHSVVPERLLAVCEL